MILKWRFVIHGGIDGYSRLPVFLVVNTNNKADSVLQAFITAIEEWGIPEKVRSDKGGENVKVAQFMLENKGIGSFISGRSVHNQRIERLWREIWSGCTSIYYQLFHYMEDQNILNIDDELHMYALHFVFQRKIQQHLDEFRSALMRRPIRTSHNKTPLQLWIQGQMDDPVVHLNQDELLRYGIDYDGPVGTEYDHVVVPETIPTPIVALIPDELEAVHDNHSQNFGIDQFLQTVQILTDQN